MKKPKLDPGYFSPKSEETLAAIYQLGSAQRTGSDLWGNRAYNMITGKAAGELRASLEHMCQYNDRISQARTYREDDKDFFEIVYLPVGAEVKSKVKWPVDLAKIMADAKAMREEKKAP